MRLDVVPGYNVLFTANHPTVDGSSQSAEVTDQP